MPFVVTIDPECILTDIGVESGGWNPDLIQQVNIFSPDGLLLTIPTFN